MTAAIQAGEAEAHEIFASDVDADRRSQLKKQYGINVYSQNGAVVAAVPTLVLAVKPQNLVTVLEEIAAEATGEHLVISIAAGKRIESIERFLPQAKVIRVMPNLPATVGAGMSVLCPGSRATDLDCTTARKLLESCGRVVEMKEEYFDVVTAISGSGPAFLAHFASCMIDAGVTQGLGREDARLLAEQTMLGTARLLLENEIDPRELIRAVSSPGGTTVAGMGVLDCPEFSTIVTDTIEAATRRGRELSA